MTARIDALGHAVRDLINANVANMPAPYDTGWSAVFRHVPEFDLKDVEDLQVIVSSEPSLSHEFNSGEIDRCETDPWLRVVLIGFVKQIEEQDDTDVEYVHPDRLAELKDLVESVSLLLYQNNTITSTQCTHTMREIAMAPFFDRDLLRENQVFRSAIAVTYA